MNLKNELLKIKAFLLNFDNREIGDFFKNDHNYELSDRVDEFIGWYQKGYVNSHSSDSFECERLRNFIEKMACWYEIRYPNQRIDDVLSGKEKEELNTNDWNVRDKYDYQSFFNSLDSNEKRYLIKPSYPELIYPIKGNPMHFHVSSDGIIEDSEYKEEFKGCHLRDVINYFPVTKRFLRGELYGAVKRIEQLERRQMLLLYCVMYRLIERGYRNYGAKRALLFANEFKLRSDIAMIYGVDLEDEKMKDFASYYIDSSGDTNINC